MGSQNSKPAHKKYSKLWQALHKTHVTRYGLLADPLIGTSSTVQEECDKALRKSLIRKQNGNMTEEERRLQEGDTWEEWSDDEEEVGFPVRPRVPLRQMTYKLAVDFSHFLKEKGGLDGIYYSDRRNKILNLYALNEWGIIDDWNAWSKGPGIRFPKCFGFCFKLVPVDLHEEAQTCERHCLVHPAQMGEDPDGISHGEILVWKFDPMLAIQYDPNREYFTDMHGLVKRK
uniref:Protein Nef n=1 Tax=Simian immunodeficiency virus agm.vervet (isolate AGM TYO-1) TaxID=11731 RepID=NEF_SIVVT|nr:RecName: Full=Protein Nef; AltName: Full=3'ORF; AltName: Full=Negative factor; Short=F-protein [Simian immunodeficiency virus (TYO-1 ISOLATE)]pir/ASLJM4/ nef protein - simian immunodeficiency virus (African green monkey isolate) [Simian immunodeficiency virus]CAA30664.1 3' orf (F orf) [Simian immunodeficiency virus]